MWVTTAQVGESIKIGDDITITVVGVHIDHQGRNAARIGVEAPRPKSVWRGELLDEQGQLKRKGPPTGDGPGAA